MKTKMLGELAALLGILCVGAATWMLAGPFWAVGFLGVLLFAAGCGLVKDAR